MDPTATLVGSLLVEPARRLWGSIFSLSGSIYSKIRNTFKYQSNLNALDQELRILVDQRNYINEELEKANNEGKLPAPKVKKWLGEVEAIKLEVEAINLEVKAIQAGTTSNGGHFCGCCLNCSMHYKLGQKVEEKRKEVEQLTKVCAFSAGMVAVDNQVKIVEHIPRPSIENQTIAAKNLTQVEDLLNNDEVRSIGVWGMGGVGKTTLVTNLNNKLKNGSLKQPFSIVIWATGSKEFDLKKVQAEITGRLHLQLEESTQRMAIQLHQRLEKERKFLLILDDVWKKIDLDSLGVPQPEIHMGLNIILTSRSLEVCRAMKTNEDVKVSVLNDDEAWELFTKNAGKGLGHIRQKAKDVARECNGLPLAINIVGAAMRGKEMIELWKDALKGLQRSVPCIN